MVPSANARHYLLKAKQRDLIAAAGGIERAALICSYGKSTVGRWAHADSPDLMPVDAMFALEEETGRHDVSEAIAAARGRRLADVETASANGSVMASHAAIVVQMGELMTTGALAFADNRLTPAEAALIDSKLGLMVQAAEEYRQVIAGIRGEGGASLTVEGAS